MRDRDQTDASVLRAEKLTDAELLARCSQRPWYFDGWDIFHTGTSPDGHRRVVPTMHDRGIDAELIVRAVNAYRGDS